MVVLMETFEITKKKENIKLGNFSTHVNFPERADKDL